MCIKVESRPHGKPGMEEGDLLRADPQGAGGLQGEVSLRRCSCRLLDSPLRRFSPPPKESCPWR
jgi:hypothetical protein